MEISWPNILPLHITQKEQDFSRKNSNPSLCQGSSSSKGEKARWTEKKTTGFKDVTSGRSNQALEAAAREASKAKLQHKVAARDHNWGCNYFEQAHILENAREASCPVYKQEFYFHFNHLTPAPVFIRTTFQSWN